MAVRIGINGFGRIGRLVLRAARDSDVQVAGVNDVTDTETLAHLLEWDTVHGHFPGTVEAAGDHLVVDGDKIQVSRESDPGHLPWRELDVEIAIEATGKFRDLHHASRHLEAGAKRVLITAPGKDAHATIVPGVNDDSYDPVHHFIVSAASCTTNCLAPTAKILHETFGIERGWMTTVHAYTNDQRILDAAHKDLRRARAAGLCMIPTTTGAARATGLVIPELAGRLDGVAVRVPTPMSRSSISWSNWVARRMPRKSTLPSEARPKARCAGSWPSRSAPSSPRTSAGTPIPRSSMHRAPRSSIDSWPRCWLGTTTSGATRIAWRSSHCGCGTSSGPSRRTQLGSKSPRRFQLNRWQQGSLEHAGPVVARGGPLRRLPDASFPRSVRSEACKGGGELARIVRLKSDRVFTGNRVVLAGAPGTREPADGHGLEPHEPEGLVHAVGEYWLDA